MNVIRKLALICALAAALVVSMPPGASATVYWSTGAAISASITSPAYNAGVGINKQVACTATASDYDSWFDDQTYQSGQSEDGIASYTWTATGGTFPGGNTGANVTWQAFDTAGIYSITCTVDDNATYADDTAVAPNVSVKVIKLDKVRVYQGGPFHEAYPSLNSNNWIYAVVWANYGTGTYHAYDKDGTVTSGGPAFLIGPEGPATIFAPGEQLADSVAVWPSDWPALSFYWEKMYQQASSADGSHNRTYSFARSQPSWNGDWGSTSPGWAEGTLRFKVTATMYENDTAPVKQTVESQDTGDSARMSVRDTTLPSDPNGKDYCRWLSAYSNVGYEWGGNWFGQFDSLGEYDGGSSSYDGYGVDCSGLVCCAARHAGYNWDPWRTGTTGLAGSYYTEGVSQGSFAAGDIFLIAGDHVISSVGRSGDNVTVIEANGTSCKVTHHAASLNTLVDQGYDLRRLVAH